MSAGAHEPYLLNCRQQVPHSSPYRMLGEEICFVQLSGSVFGYVLGGIGAAANFVKFQAFLSAYEIFAVPGGLARIL